MSSSSSGASWTGFARTPEAPTGEALRTDPSDTEISLDATMLSLAAYCRHICFHAFIHSCVHSFMPHTFMQSHFHAFMLRTLVHVGELESSWSVFDTEAAYATLEPSDGARSTSGDTWRPRPALWDTWRPRGALRDTWAPRGALRDTWPDVL